MGCSTSTGPFSSICRDPRQSVDSYVGASGPMSFGTSSFGMEIVCQQWRRQHGRDSRGILVRTYDGVLLSVPRGYVSLCYSSSATYSDTTVASLAVTPGTYVWTWGNGAEPELHASDPCTDTAASNWASGRHHQSRNLDRKLFSQTERLGESARIDHQRVFSIWNNEQLRTHYRPAKSHREHLPKCQCEY